MKFTELSSYRFVDSIMHSKGLGTTSIKASGASASIRCSSARGLYISCSLGHNSTAKAHVVENPYQNAAECCNVTITPEE